MGCKVKPTASQLGMPVTLQSRWSYLASNDHRNIRPIRSSIRPYTMRRNPPSRSDTLDSSPRRRRIEIGSAGTSRNSRAGVIDRKLIEGSHQPRAHDVRLRDPSIMVSPETGPYEVDFQLDAFGKWLNFQLRPLLSLRSTRPRATCIRLRYRAHHNIREPYGKSQS